MVVHSLYFFLDKSLSSYLLEVTSGVPSLEPSWSFSNVLGGSSRVCSDNPRYHFRFTSIYSRESLIDPICPKKYSRVTAKTSSLCRGAFGDKHNTRNAPLSP
jgi:hypothetical protein